MHWICRVWLIHVHSKFKVNFKTSAKLYFVLYSLYTVACLQTKCLSNCALHNFSCYMAVIPHIQQEVKQIHTPGPSRAVQRSVSVLGETGLFQRESAIWRPLQIVGAVPFHSWGDMAWDRHRVGWGNWRGLQDKAVVQHTASKALPAWEHIK